MQTWGLYYKNPEAEDAGDPSPGELRVAFTVDEATGTINDLRLPVHRQADAAMRNLLIAWAGTGDSHIDDFREFVSLSQPPGFAVRLSG